MRIYGFNLEKHILPKLGTSPLRSLSRANIEACLLNLKLKGHGTSTVRNVRATFSTILQAAVERGYVEKNVAHGIRIRETNVIRKERRFHGTAEIRMLLGALSEPCRTVVSIAVLTGMRIGEILALRWKRLDLLRGLLSVAETYSGGDFGSPKTKSSRRTIPISSVLQAIFEKHRAVSKSGSSEELVFQTPAGTPLDAHNLYNRELAPSCDRIGLARLSWHSFRHTHATLLSQTGEPLKTAQSLLGHSDLETTLAVYIHDVPDSQKRAVERVAEVLFSEVVNSAAEQCPTR
jgi:integrase